MLAAIIQIGNSRGLRLPKAIIKQCGLVGAVDLAVRDGKLVITPLKKPRSSWDAAFVRMATAGDDRLLDAHRATRWEPSEWEW